MSTMLGVTTSNTLSVVDLSFLKRTPSSIPSCLSLIDTPTASSWTPDNAFLYISSARAIHKYDPSSNAVKEIFSSTNTEAITELVTKDSATLIFSTSDKVCILECGSTPKVSQTFESHKAPITSFSLSNDAALLASTSASAVHIHNLSLGSYTMLRGLALNSQAIKTCAFHPLLRTRLLVIAGQQIMVYDTTRPSAPAKMIVMGDGVLGDIIAVACSPFSKTLAAVATSGGYIGLVDIEKEKPPPRAINFKTPLTSISFSPEGASVYAGTENGKLVVLDLRYLDKPPRTILVSEMGNRIETITFQRKAKSSVEPTTKSSSSLTSRASADVLAAARQIAGSAQTQSTKTTMSKPASSPARPKIARVGSAASPRARRVPSSIKEGTGANSSVAKHSATVATKKIVLSPAKDPLRNSQNAGDIPIPLGTSKPSGTKVTHAKKPSTVSPISSRSRPSPLSKTERVQPIASSRTLRAVSTEPEAAPRRARTLPSATSRGETRKTSESASATPTDTSPLPSIRPRTVSSSSRASVAISARSTRVSGRSSSHTTSARSSSDSRPTSSASRAGAPSTPLVLPLPASASIASLSRTPSPNLPGVPTEPTTPIPVQKKSMGVLGLGTPEVDAWIRAGKGEGARARDKGKGKVVGFKDYDEDGNDKEEEGEHTEDDERERELSMQISPRRPAPGSSAQSPSWASSPLRHAGSPSTGMGSSGGSAHDFLRTIVQDVMFDFRRETREEMVGLHLDLLRMGRGWKKELRSLMDEYVGDLRELREENMRLREENERLRRM